MTVSDDAPDRTAADRDDADRDDATDRDPSDEFERANPIDAEPSGSRAEASGSHVETSGSHTESSGSHAEASAPSAEDAASDDRLAIPVETIAVLNWLGDIGVDGVESRLNKVPVGDLSARTEHVKIGYAGAETVGDQFGVADRAGARVHLREPFAGTVLVLFPVKSANRAASLMLQSAVEDVESVVSTPMGRDALTELCNAMANGFVDEWAELFDTPIDTGPPVAVQNPELTLVQRIASVADVGLYLAARLRIPEHDVEASVFVFPGDEAFVRELSKLDLDVIDR
ncbi:chemotaxis protein CheC [Halorussus gelatinilyticus]|uniref:Chemotaxis protein CheC n=1 Tax=Halorussus gelatinilyticus TaxID=2937524 RepID=A0A8U0IM34_9EURY|nr:chemotaxis protein CheC [Halorussus gelatinilyticus]UPW01274.1 chemotaxis protein CheC [Halorussus gelatinilyticus]